jgi:hypothetical protein
VLLLALFSSNTTPVSCVELQLISRHTESQHSLSLKMSRKTHQQLLNTSDHSDQSNTSKSDTIHPFQVSASHTTEKQTLDAVIESIPVGWFHYRLLFICGLAFMADGLEVSLLSFISACGE